MLQLKPEEEGQLALADNMNAEVVRKRTTHQGELVLIAEYRFNCQSLSDAAPKESQKTKICYLLA